MRPTLYSESDVEIAPLTESRVHNLVGRVFGKLTVIGYAGSDGQALWWCRCECGRITKTHGGNLKNGTKSCGCVYDGIFTKHGLTPRKATPPEFHIWCCMRDRCEREGSKYYRNYGGRGISVCDRWSGEMGFAHFMEDMGSRPTPKHSIDRIDVNGNYEPGNCRWATSVEQCNNKRNNRTMTYNGETLSVAEWSRRTGIRYRTILMRLNLGWPPEDVIHKPLRPITGSRASWISPCAPSPDSSTR